MFAGFLNFSRSTGKSMLLAVVMGVVIGTLLSAVVVYFRAESPTLTRVQILTLEDGQGPGVPYAIEVELERDGYPFVVHVDEWGWPSLLFPITSPAYIPAGHPALLPDPTGAATWWTDAPTADASLLVCIADRPSVSISRLTSMMESEAAQGDDPKESRERVARLLRRHVGPTVVHPLHLTANPSN